MTLNGPGTGPRVLALVAARNEATSVGATVEALRRIPAVDEVLVVDDGSTDGTADAARDAGAWVLHLAEGVGKGGAVAAGVASTSEIDVYLLVDADAGATAEAAAVLLAPVLGSSADMATGVLPAAGGKGGFGLVRDLAAAGIRRACGFVAEAPLSGQRAVRGELLRSLALAPRFGLETALTIDATRAGARLVEVPVAMDHRHTGRGLSGFAHRGRQGADVMRALWVRLTSGRARVGLIAAALAVAVVLALWSGSRWEPDSVAAAPDSSPAAKVLLIGMPGLGFDDLGSGATPNLDRMVATGALGAMSVRTLSQRPQPSPEGYATLGAGSQVRAGPAAGDALNDGAGVVLPRAQEVVDGAGRHRPTPPGALGDALHSAGKRTAVVGNADLAPGLAVPTVSGRRITERPAAVALMDHEGRVDGGQVEPGLLLERTDEGPFGWRADAEQVAAATNLALAEADVVLVDPGDLDRAAALVDIEAPPRFTVPARARALRDTDALLGRLTADLPPDILVLVVSVVPPGDEWRLTPIVATGPGVIHGYLHSPSTKRLGLVTLTDLAPTVLDAVGADVPGAMIGRPLRYHPGEPDLARLRGLDDAASYRQSIYYLTILGFILFQALVYLVVAGVLRLPRDEPPPGWLGALRVAVLAVAAFPLATYLFRALPFAPGWGWAAVPVLVAMAGAIALVASRTGTRSPRRPMAPLAWILGVTLAVLLVDVATGARLQLASLMGYSPETVARFYGVGNPTFAVLAATALLASALHLEHAPRRHEALVAVGAVLAFVVLVDGAPGLGDDVGGMLALPIVFTLAMVAFSGRRLSWRSVVLAVAATVVVVGLAVVVDLVRAPDARSHLGRLAAETVDDGQGGLVTTVARKAEASFRILRASVWSWLVPVIAAFGLFVLARGRAAELLPPGSPRRIGLAAALAAGLLGFVVNDSGVIVTAVVLVFVGPFLALAALSQRAPSRPVLWEPSADRPSSSPSPSPAAGA